MCICSWVICWLINRKSIRQRGRRPVEAIVFSALNSDCIHSRPSPSAFYPQLFNVLIQLRKLISQSAHKTSCGATIRPTGMEIVAVFSRRRHLSRSCCLSLSVFLSQGSSMLSVAMCLSLLEPSTVLLASPSPCPVLYQVMKAHGRRTLSGICTGMMAVGDRWEWCPPGTRDSPTFLSRPGWTTERWEWRGTLGTRSGWWCSDSGLKTKGNMSATHPAQIAPTRGTTAPQ